ncbi:DUF5085 family protein [Mesobacillus subterraneus]|uniref:DUF5085 family protein n=1 Tax=Mesobacillus subterraneus TaxID=285983 RepID=UPI001CFDBE3E|nr:DUF5085 family protein [Mesobacillus subterraneus]
MRIKRCPIVFNNVISTKSICKENEWPSIAKELRNAVILNGLYGTGPIIYQVEKVNDTIEEAEYTFYLPVNEPIQMSENDKYTFYETFRIEDGLTFRHADLDENIEDAYELLRMAAKDNQLELTDPFYNIYLDVYGEGIIDIFAPIKKRRFGVINPQDHIRYKNVISRKYRFHYRKMDEVMKDFINDVAQQKASIRGPLFYSINNVPLDEVISGEFFLPIREDSIDLLEDQFFHSYFSIENMASVTIHNRFEKNTQVAYALLLEFLEQNKMEQSTPFFHVISGDETLQYMNVKVGYLTK